MANQGLRTKVLDRLGHSGRGGPAVATRRYANDNNRAHQVSGLSSVAGGGLADNGGAHPAAAGT